MRVACLIPAYNEAARIGAVLSVVLGHPALDRVLVVDDGSTDGTAEVARAAGAEVLALPRNGGKTAAVAAGIAALEARWILMLDSDLQGLDRAAVSALLAPVLCGEAEVAISLRGNAPLLWRLIGLDYISGERVLPRAQIARHGPALAALPRFGIEVFLNRLWIADGCRVAVVRWPGVASPPKAQKRGLWRGIRADLAMLADIFRTIPAPEALHQIRALRRLSRSPLPEPRHQPG
ncbi:glycosyl transferase family protein [Cereibacter sphaeroides WS8N]|uniref:glycosyltransferase family 2 protein n=1 Tax=Cereibacter sphaeroides TaxID=1063 RepID=UPI00020DF62D|nr:glycosyltransferase [Cereibacter sphaeroides]EGJ20610.1 glycosyl transferase family protein [Cereibacter sphaeroides WS8N]